MQHAQMHHTPHIMRIIRRMYVSMHHASRIVVIVATIAIAAAAAAAAFII